MARSDLIKRLFRSYNQNDREAFHQVALEVIEDERRKNHKILANELTRILLDKAHPVPNTSIGPVHSLAPLPKDEERGASLVDVRAPSRDLSTIALTDQQESTLQSVMQEFREIDILAAHGLRPSKNLLFFGPPGCGKTVTAEAIAFELQLPLLYVRFDSLVSSFLGETAANLRKVFDYASSDRWVILFDEFDSIGQSRSAKEDHPELRRVVNTFLQLLDGFTGSSLIIAATNNEESIDRAVWRRFDEAIEFSLPDQEQRRFLVGKILGDWLVGTAPDRVLEEMEGLSHADIERALLRAKREAVLSGRRKISVESVVASTEREQRRNIHIRAH